MQPAFPNDGQGQIWINWHKGYLDAFQGMRIAVRQEAIFEEIIFFDGKFASVFQEWKNDWEGSKTVLLITNWEGTS